MRFVFQEFCSSKGAAKPCIRADGATSEMLGREATELGDHSDMGE